MIQRVLVLGGGSAGLLAATTLKAKIPALQVEVVRSPEIGVIGVGEGTTFGFPMYLHGYLRIDPSAFLREVQTTWKMGLRFVNWGPREHFHYGFAPCFDQRGPGLTKSAGYYAAEGFDYPNSNVALMEENRAFVRRPDGKPQMFHDYAYHIENRRFVGFMEKYAHRIGVEIHDDKVERVTQNDQGVESLILQSGRVATADLFIDASGFSSLLLSQALGEPFVSYRSTLFNDRAVVGSWDRRQEVIKPYTTCEAMTTGWCWQIDHEDCINRGYVYSSDFISDDAAEAEFRAKNPRVGETRLVRFKSGRAERRWVKNVVAIGNSGGFVEPLEATAIMVICNQAAALTNMLIDCDREPAASSIRQHNEHSAGMWDAIRRFLGIHFKFNPRGDSPYWRAAAADADLCGGQEIVDYYRDNGPCMHANLTLFTQQDVFKAEGWWALLTGQGVPHNKPHKPTPDEQAAWRRVRQHYKSQAQAGFTIRQALDLLRSPNWRWNPQYYGEHNAPLAS
jgi:tryptophan halogenase